MILIFGCNAPYRKKNKKVKADFNVYGIGHTVEFKQLYNFLVALKVQHLYYYGVVVCTPFLARIACEVFKV